MTYAQLDRLPVSLGMEPRKRRPPKGGRRSPSLVAGFGLPVVVVVVEIAAARLRQAAADHVANGEQGDVEPGVLGVEAVVVVLERGGDQDRDDRDDVGDQLAGLGRVLRLGAEPTRGPAVGVDLVVGGGGAGRVGHECGPHLVVSVRTRFLNAVCARWAQYGCCPSLTVRNVTADTRNARVPAKDM